MGAIFSQELFLIGRSEARAGEAAYFLLLVGSSKKVRQTGGPILSDQDNDACKRYVDPSCMIFLGAWNDPIQSWN